MAKKKTLYRCSECNYETVSWTGKCPSCQNWGTLEEVETAVAASSSSARAGKKSKALSLKEIQVDDKHRVETGISELDRVLGGGLVRDSVTILTARPGAGKSTLFLELSYVLGKKGLKILYLSGEESQSQIKSRAKRIMKEIPDNIWIVSTTSMDEGVVHIEEIDPDLILLDSIQTFTLQEHSSRPGSPVQTVECANKLVEIAKDSRRPRAVMMIGHMTKADEMAGLRTLEHLVDTVLYLEGESDDPLRTILSTKNRFGRTGEIGLFEMVEEGLKEIKDPSEFFLTNRKEPVPGSAIAMIKEGSRMMAVEVESLISTSFMPYPTRIGDSLRKDQLNTLISILEERGGIKLFDKNVILKTTGGLRLSEQSVNLAIIMSIVSAYYNKGIPDETVFVSEVGLTGELKKAPQIESRIRELDRLGYKKIYTYPFDKEIETENLEIVKCSTLKEVMSKVF